MAGKRGARAGGAGAGGDAGRAAPGGRRARAPARGLKTRTLPERLRARLGRRPDLLPAESTILVALSGGPDSSALLHLLLELAPDFGWRLSAAHFDHALRPESATEAEAVARRAEAAGVPCAVGRAPENMERTQAAFRRARYRFLRTAARQAGASRIATGHQADDQAETVLFRLLRGAGLRGLGGIPERRGPVVRPLLSFSGAALRRYLTGRGVPWLEDPSNRDPRWVRARLRHEVLPLLEEVNGHPVRPRLRALGRAARRADRALERTARAALRAVVLRPHEPGEKGGGRRAGPSPEGPERPARTRIARDRLRSYDPELQARVVRAIARCHGVFLTRGGTRAAVEFIKRGRSGAAMELSEELRLGREFDVLWIGPPPVGEPDRTLRIPGPRAGHARTSIGGREYTVRWGGERGAGRSAPIASRRAVLPLGRTAFPLVLRGPRPGDRIRLRAGTRKLKKLFVEERVPRSERARVPVLEDAQDRLVWAAGLGSARFAVPAPSEEKFIVTIDELRAAVPVDVPEERELLYLAGGRRRARIVYPAAEIARRVRRMGRAITEAYPEGADLLVLGLLKGSFIFLSDLVRQIHRPLHVDFLVAASYGPGTASSGRPEDVALLYDPAAPLAGRHVVLVEDIVDSGATLSRMARALRERDPASLECCALLHKHVAEELELEPRWVGFDAPREFLVGYGLDHAEDFRHLPFIASLQPEETAARDGGG